MLERTSLSKCECVIAISLDGGGPAISGLGMRISLIAYIYSLNEEIGKNI
jgi:hypothetical protein